MLFSAYMIVWCCTYAGGDINTILKNIEFNLTMTTDARAKVDLVQQKAGEGSKDMSALWYRRDRDNAYLS